MKNFPHTTRLGRIVYNRKPTTFTWRDVLRVIRQVQAPGTFEFGKKLSILRIRNVLLRKVLGIPSFYDLIELIAGAYDDVDAFFESIELELQLIFQESEDFGSGTIRVKTVAEDAGDDVFAGVVTVEDHLVLSDRLTRFWNRINVIIQEALKNG